MANVTITQLPAAGPITGQELVPIVQNGQTVQTTTAAIAASPDQFQTFLTLNQEPTLPNSRALSGSTGVGLVDGGALSSLQVTLNGTSGSLEASGPGIIAKTGGTVTPRQIVAGGNGLSVTNGTGISGNPTIALTGALAALAGLAGTGILGLVNGSSVTGLSILGTTDQINVADGSGPGNPTISIASDPTLPGTGAVLMPGGTTAQRPGGTGGQLRFNSETGFMEYYTGSMWANLSAGASVANNIGGGAANQIVVQAAPSSTTFITAPTVANTFLEWSGSAFQWSANPLGTVTSVDVSGGTTGLTYSGGPITSSGTITMAGTLITSNGGTGLSSYTAGDTLYYASGTALSKLAIGSAGFFMTSSGTAPAWTDPANLAVGSATNLAGGAAGGLPYQTGAGATTFLALGTATHILTAGASAPQYTDPANITVGAATNVAGGAANQIVFNTGAGASSFVVAPTVANTVLEWSGSAFQWAAGSAGTVTSVDVSGGTTGLTTSGGPITTSGTITIAGTLITSNGGTGLTSYTAGDLSYYAAGTTLTALPIGGANSVLASTGTAPNWVDSVTLTTVNATTFDTNVAAAGVTLSGVTLAADGTDANIDILMNPKGTGGVGIGGDPTGVVAGVTITSKFCVKHNGTGQVGGFVHANNSTAGSGAGVFACRSRGTIASPTVVQNNDALAVLSFAGYDGTDLALAAQIDVEVDGTPGSNDMPGRIRFLTTADGTQSPVEALRIDSAQNIRVANLTASKPVFSDANKNLTSTGEISGGVFT